MATELNIRFNDGDGYERSMGVWSRIAGEVFIDWLAPGSGLRWLDVGCGSGAFTALLMDRCAPSETQGVDPSEAQLVFARARATGKHPTFQQGDAMALPFENDRFDAAVMALVIFFVPEPSQGVSEMARVVRPGGAVAAYAWDVLGGGFPFEPIYFELRALGIVPPKAPREDASRIDTMHELWVGAGLEAVETRTITIERTFANFEDFWNTSTALGSLRPVFEAMTPDELAALKARVRARLPAADTAGRITYSARANAVKGRVPG